MLSIQGTALVKLFYLPESFSRPICRMAGITHNLQTHMKHPKNIILPVITANEIPNISPALL